MRTPSVGRLLVAAGLVATLLASSGCYYFSAQTSLRQAGDAVKAAQEVGAAEKAPYQYTMAEQYLMHANSENRLADFASAQDFAEKAKASAEQAKQLSGGGAAQ